MEEKTTDQTQEKPGQDISAKEIESWVAGDATGQLKPLKIAGHEKEARKTILRLVKRIEKNNRHIGQLEANLASADQGIRRLLEVTGSKGLSEACAKVEAAFAPK